jgi:hypothetical protein
MVLSVIGIFALAALSLSAQQQERPAQSRQDSAQLSAYKITENVYEVRGGSGANAGFIITDTEVLVVDAKTSPESARDMLAAIRAVGTPMRSGQTFARELDIYSGTSLVRFLHFGPAHTEGDAVVYIPSEKVAFLGDLIFIGRDPLIHKHKNGSSFGLVKVLQSVLELDAEIFLHGHGAPADREEVRAFIMALEEKQNTIKSLIREGKSLDQVKAAFKVEDSPARPGRTSRPSLVEIIFTEIKENHFREPEVSLTKLGVL